MSVTSPEPGKWEITTPKGRKITVEAPYITETEVKVLSILTDLIIDKIEELVWQYEIEVSLDPSTLKGAGKWRRKQQ
jgi:hypothetical protein